MTPEGRAALERRETMDRHNRNLNGFTLMVVLLVVAATAWLAVFGTGQAHQ